MIQSQVMKKHKISENTSVYSSAKKKLAQLSKTIDLKRLFEVFIKYSILATLLSYFISSILLLFRSWHEGIPFVPLNIVQTVIADIYFLIILAIFFTGEYLICEMWHLIRHSNRKTSEKVFGRTLTIFIIIMAILMIAFTISLFTKNTKNFLNTTLLLSMLFLLLPGYFHLFMTKLSPKATVVIECILLFLFAFLFVCNIPMNMGGLAPQNIEYCREEGACYNYKYFGNYDGMLILKNDDNVVLEPIGRGTIKYKQFNPSEK